MKMAWSRDRCYTYLSWHFVSVNSNTKVKKMAKPSEKSPEITQFLEDRFGRSTALKNDVCIPAPTGCGGPATEFDDDLSRKEYTMSGLCQNCQDSVFGPSDED